MPVVLKPSKEFLEQMGDRVASEIVNWFNTMDASQKHELRDINEQNFARFDAKLEQRTAELHANLDAKIEKTKAELKEVLERRLGEYTRWSYLTWAVQAAMIIGLYFK